MTADPTMGPHTVRARVTFLPASAGGRATPAMSGIRPILRLGEVLTSCVVRSAEDIESFQPEHPYDVAIEIIFWHEYGNLFDPEAPVSLYDGSRLIATGEYLPPAED
ncbi:hypothetical protein AB0940_24840 [Streptomyces sp. NPDC006656]|uniref:hypothetical protein n=1 Tax=Streptomyces sp. NPDC006656 TaxID=3156899 RepID=UPI003451EA94